MEQKKLLFLGGVFVLLIGGVGLFIYFQNKPAKQPSVVPPTYTTPAVSEEIPTLSPERMEIIRELETHVVAIQNKSFSPPTLTIKLHDQVEWQNKDTETFQIKGENWGNVPIEPGESFTRAFETAGTFSYSCALHPETTGTIIVE